MMNLAMIGALGKMTEWELHCRGAIRNDVSADEIRAIVHVIAIYCGVPQGVECFRSARKVLEHADML
jgi:4-carboxymuconolactone decarboxylase